MGLASLTTITRWRLASRSQPSHIAAAAAAATAAAEITSARAFFTSAAAAHADAHADGGSAADAKTRHEDAIKDSLRRLYKLVHPDLFGDNHFIKAENERSFKLLQEYLQQARSGDARSPAAFTAYNFSFYIRQQQQQQQQQQQEPAADADPVGAAGARPSAPPEPGSSRDSGAAGSPDAQDGFLNAQVTLPPPQSLGGTSQALGPTARRALAKLFHACGLPPTLVAACEGEAGLSGAHVLSLASFLPEATEALRQREAGGADPSVRLANLRGAFRLGRQLLVSFSSKCDLGARKRVRLLEQLARVLDTHPELELQGCQILVGPDATGIDRLGQICLHQDESDLDWQQLLTQADVAFILQRRQHIQAVKRLEGLVARSVGFLMIYATPAHLPELSYRLFLERLAGHAALAGPACSGQLKQDVSLCVLPAHARHMAAGCPLGRPLGDGCVVDDATGIIYILDELSAVLAYEAVTSHGPRALLAARVHASKQAEESSLVERVRRALRLKRLMRDAALSAHDFGRACKRLLDQAEALAPVLDGSSLRIGFANRIAPDGSCVEIAWDFID